MLPGDQTSEMLRSPNFLLMTPSHFSCPPGDRRSVHLHLEMPKPASGEQEQAPGYTHCGQVLLCHALALSALLDHFAHLQRNSVMVQLFCFSVELGRVLCNKVLFVLACCPYHSKQEKKKQTKDKQNKAQSCAKKYQSAFSKHSAAQNPRDLSRFQHANISTNLNQILSTREHVILILLMLMSKHSHAAPSPFSTSHLNFTPDRQDLAIACGLNTQTTPDTCLCYNM